MHHRYCTFLFSFCFGCRANLFLGSLLLNHTEAVVTVAAIVATVVAIEEATVTGEAMNDEITAATEEAMARIDPTAPTLHEMTAATLRVKKGRTEMTEAPTLLEMTEVRTADETTNRGTEARLDDLKGTITDLAVAVDDTLMRGVAGIRTNDERGVLRSLGLVVRMLDLWLRALLQQEFRNIAFQRFISRGIIGNR